MKKVIVAVSGGADSVYLLLATKSKGVDPVAAHLNHLARGRDSDADQRFVEDLGKTLGIQVVSGKIPGGRARRHRTEGGAAATEARMRKSRYRFLETVRQEVGADRILVAHTADDQVETVLMRILEGAGISGLKGIPRKTAEGIERPILDVWREEILEYLQKHKIPYRVDRSNLDTRFERNWIRHVLIPLLEKRYGKSVKKRIFVLGERFREIDAFLEDTTRKWMKRNVITDNGVDQGEAGGPGGAVRGGVRFPRRSYSRLPSVVRKKILQLLCFEWARVAPNERLLESMDRLMLTGGPSAKLALGKGASLFCRYGEAVLRPGTGAGAPGPAGKRGLERAGGHLILPLDGPGRYRIAFGKGEAKSDVDDLFAAILWEEKGRISAARAKALAEGENEAAFARETLRLPLTVRPLRPGDRIRPFGLEAEKKVKEILIDRKVPREERLGRPVVCDAGGKILWIPGVVRSAHAPVSPGTRRTIMLRMTGSNWTSRQERSL